ncbi:hypothetical protein [Deinococcus murrayi]|uniref:hypothetical protein n=1 Tax=Deinococcus murrayi TaxID=68910 RepID=UPI00146FC17A|nr:hypothetical protein [Deinococcus murrayi]
MNRFQAQQRVFFFQQLARPREGTPQQGAGIFKRAGLAAPLLSLAHPGLYRVAVHRYHLAPRGGRL